MSDELCTANVPFLFTVQCNVLQSSNLNNKTWDPFLWDVTLHHWVIVTNILKVCNTLIFKNLGLCRHLKMYAPCFFKMLSKCWEPVYLVTHHHIPGEWNPQLHCCENLKTCSNKTRTWVQYTGSFM